MPNPITAFIARSFSTDDAPRIEPILKFLQTFSTLGLICRSAEPAEAEHVSEKIQRMISESEVFIGFFTRKYPVSAGDGEPRFWMPPPWVLQESGCAVAHKKKLIFFKEVGVSLPELQGDLEYIEFDPANLVPAMQRTNEMISRILAHGLSITVVTTIEHQAPPPEPAKPESEAKVPQPSEGSGISTVIYRLHQALQGRDEAAAKKTYEEGLALQKPEGELAWTLFYEKRRYFFGHIDAWERLKDLQKSHADSPLPMAAIADCLKFVGEKVEAAEAYQVAASKDSGNSKATHLRHAGELLFELKDFAKATEVLLLSIGEADGPTRLKCLKALYENLKSSERLFEAFGVAEYSLSENSAQGSLHFQLGYDYSNEALNELAIFHYEAVLKLDATESAAMNNMAVAYSALEMPISACRQYQDASEKGSTLASGNLGFKYLDAGFVDDAEHILAGALEEPEHDVMVDSCIAERKKRIEAEDKKRSELLELAVQQRTFFKNLGRAVIEPDVADITGEWKFPDVEIELTLSHGDLVGHKLKHVPVSRGLSALLGGASVEEHDESYDFDGKLRGRVCEFTLMSDPDVNGMKPITTKVGFLVFDPAGNSARVLEREPERKLYSIAKIVKKRNELPKTEIHD